MSVKDILSDPNVLSLIKTFDLTPPMNEKYSLNISDFELENGFIVINEIQLMNKKGEFIKNVDPETVFDQLNQFVVTFRKTKNHESK